MEFMRNMNAMPTYNDAPPDYTNTEVSTGTSIMAVEFDDFVENGQVVSGGVVIGADSRTTMGEYIANRVTDKLTCVSDYIYCCRSGSAADTQAIADIVRYYLSLMRKEMDDEPTVQTAANIFRELCYNNREQLLAGMIVAGWDSKTKQGQVYTVPVGGMCVRQNISIGGSGSSYIYGYVDANYKKGMTKNETIQLVKNSLALAMLRDGSSGGVIRICAITENGAERFLYTGKELGKFYEEEEEELEANN